MLLDEIKKRIVDAMKAKRVVEREILRVAASEIQAAQNRATDPLTDEDAHKIIKKLIKSNQESIAATERAEMKTKLTEENAILEGLLPKRWDLERIVAELAAVADGIKAAKSDGQATGVAMKHLKSVEAPVDGKDVAAAVSRIRAAS
jgi:uncharacterized protein YqeY